ncbi:hypothetical protein HDU84_009482 [Entophlyctis sp. JEL0112]|nr:hypothetical protein HDU84_009482 [Entophlyctis sp. JEL0112]
MKYLRQHGITHSNEKPYVCLICEKSFKRTSEIKVHHAFTHNSEVKAAFKCRLCLESFDSKSDLSSHELSHKTKPAQSDDKTPDNAINEIPSAAIPGPISDDKTCEKCQKTFLTTEV